MINPSYLSDAIRYTAFRLALSDHSLLRKREIREAAAAGLFQYVQDLSSPAGAGGPTPVSQAFALNGRVLALDNSMEGPGGTAAIEALRDNEKPLLGNATSVETPSVAVAEQPRIVVTPSVVVAEQPRPVVTPGNLFEIILKDDPALLATYMGNIHQVEKHGYNAMMVAAIHRCPKALDWCIKNGVGRNSIDNPLELEELLTPLMFSCLAWPDAKNLDSPECAELLLAAGADRKAKTNKGNTPLHLAVNSDFIEIVKFLSKFPDVLTIRNNEGKTPLELAVAKGKFAIAAVLRQAAVLREAASQEDNSLPITVDANKFGCDVKILEPKIKLKKRGPDSTHATLIQASIGDYLCSRARNGEIPDLNKFRIYLDSVDSYGRNIFMNACLARQFGVVQWYLDGVPADKRTQLFSRDDYLRTPVHFAALSKSEERADDPACMIAALNAGGDVNAVDYLGATALHYAAVMGRGQLVDVLLSRRECTPDIIDSNGKNAAECATEAGHHEIAAKIKSAIEIKAKAPPFLPALFDMILKNNIEALKKHEDGFSVEDPATGRNSFMFAVQQRSLKASEFLLEHGRVNPKLKNRKAGNLTAMMYACMPGATEPGRNLDDDRFVKLLVNKGADPLAKNKDGDTALHFAVASQFRFISEYLSTIPGTLDARNSAGQTPLELAEALGHSDIAADLRDAQEEASRVSVQEEMLSNTAAGLGIRGSDDLKMLRELEAIHPGALSGVLSEALAKLKK